MESFVARFFIIATAFVALLLLVLVVVALVKLHKLKEDLFDVQEGLDRSIGGKIYVKGQEIIIRTKYYKEDILEALEDGVVVSNKNDNANENLIQEELQSEKEEMIPASSAQYVDAMDEDDMDEEIGGKHYDKRATFAEKLLLASKNIQSYYDILFNEFVSYRKVSGRVSAKCVSFRYGRQLIAKITIRGNMMKMHLALDINKYEYNKYFQKDMSDMKAYVDVPFTVKVISDRGFRNAIDLIGKLAEVVGTSKKTKFVEYDNISELADKVDFKN